MSTLYIRCLLFLVWSINCEKKQSGLSDRPTQTSWKTVRMQKPNQDFSRHEERATHEHAFTSLAPKGWSIIGLMLHGRGFYRRMEPTSLQRRTRQPAIKIPYLSIWMCGSYSIAHLPRNENTFLCQRNGKSVGRSNHPFASPERWRRGFFIPLATLWTCEPSLSSSGRPFLIDFSTSPFLAVEQQLGGYTRSEQFDWYYTIPRGASLVPLPEFIYLINDANVSVNAVLRTAASIHSLS